MNQLIKEYEVYRAKCKNENRLLYTSLIVIFIAGVFYTFTTSNNNPNSISGGLIITGFITGILYSFLKFKIEDFHYNKYKKLLNGNFENIILSDFLNIEEGHKFLFNRFIKERKMYFNQKNPYINNNYDKAYLLNISLAWYEFLRQSLRK